MDKVATAAITLIFSFTLWCWAQSEVYKDHAAAGYIVIDKVAYRITKVQ